MRYSFNIKYDKSKNNQIIVEDPFDEKSKNDNYLISTAFGFLTNPLTEQELFTPGGFEDVKKYSYLIAAYLRGDKTWEQLSAMSIDELKGLAKTNENLIYPQTQVAYHKQNMVAAKLIGVFAVANVSHAFMALGNAEINCLFYDKIITINGELFGSQKTDRKGKFIVGGSFTIDPIYGFSGEKVSKTLALFLAASVDAVKDPVLNLLNINLKSVNLAVTLARMGFDIKTISLFMNQPSIKKVINQSILNDSNLDDEIQKELTRLSNVTSPNDYKVALDAQSMKFTDNDWLKTLKDETDLDAVRNLTLAKQLLNYSRVFSNITGVTKQNSISSAVGPTILDNIDAKISAEKLQLNLFKDRISQETYNLAWNLISKTLYDTQHNLAKELLNAQRFITATWRCEREYKRLKATIPTEKFTDKLKLKFINAYTGVVIQPNWQQLDFISSNEEYSSNPLKAMILNYPLKFISNRGPQYLEKYPNNEVIKMLMEASTTDGLKIQLPLDNPTKIDELQTHMAEIMRYEPLLGKELILYAYARGGWSFNAKFPLMKLTTTQILENIDGYFDQLQNVSELKPNDEFTIQFKLNNHIVDQIIPIEGSVEIYSSIDHHGNILYHLSDMTGLITIEEDKIYKIVSNEGSYLIALKYDPSGNYHTGTVNDIKFTDLDVEVKEIKFLGNGNDIFEYGNIDVNNPIVLVDSSLSTEIQSTQTDKPNTIVPEAMLTNVAFDGAVDALQSLLSEDVQSINLKQFDPDSGTMFSLVDTFGQESTQLMMLLTEHFKQNNLPLTQKVIDDLKLKKKDLNLC